MRSKDYQVFGILVNFLFIALIQGHPIQGRTRYDLKLETNLQLRSNKICFTIYIVLHQKPLFMQSFEEATNYYKVSRNMIGHLAGN